MKKKLIYIVLIIALFFAVAFLNRHLTFLSSAYELTETTVFENAPPEIVFCTVVIGGLRGIIADILWMRVMHSQERGDYFDVVPVSRWITRLQPRFSSVWIFLAWNMAYNISVEVSDFQERWRWVKHGIELLRDEALRYNPNSPSLYRQLGWMFQHKIGASYDEAHFYYKAAWAEEMLTVLGDPEDSLDSLQDPGLNEEAVMADEKVRQFLMATQQHGFDFPGQYLGVIQKRMPLPPAIDQLLQDPQNKETVRKLIRYLKVRRLREKLKLDPALMLEVDQEYGPFDWTLPQGHAVYWAYKGLLCAKPEDTIFYHRMIFQSMNAAFEHGRLIYNKSDGSLFMTPNIEIADNLQRMFTQMFEEYDPNVIRPPYRMFLRSAVMIMYSFNRAQKAQGYFTKLKEEFPGEFEEEHLERFVLREMTGYMKDLRFNETRAMITGILRQSYWWLAAGDYERAVGFERMALLLWTTYSKGQAGKDRFRLPKFPIMKQEVLQQCLEQVFPPFMRARLSAEINAK